MNRTSSLSLVAAAVLATLFQAGLTRQALAVTPPLPYSTGFETTDGFTTGTVNGQNGWSVFDGTGTVTTAAAFSGTQSLLYVPTPSVGAVVKVSTPEFAPSGETPSVNVPNPVSNFMSEDFWFKTVATSSDNLYISTSLGNPASVRNTWLGILSGENTNTGTGITGDLYAEAVSYDGAGNEIDTDSSPLTWGAWYHATVDETYVNGPANDIVTYTISDASNNVVWTLTTGSWEGFYANNIAEQSPGPVVSDRSTFGGRSGEGIYVDNFSMSDVAAPEPASLGLLGVGALALVSRRRRTA